jgi:hypothetical protein
MEIENLKNYNFLYIRINYNERVVLFVDNLAAKPFLYSPLIHYK